MNQQIRVEEERTMAVRVETDVVERDQLARLGFSTEEIVALFCSDARTKLAVVTA